MFYLEGVGEARKVLLKTLRFMIRLGSSLLWSYRLKCLLLRDVGVWFSALSVEKGSVEHLGHSLPAHVDRSLSVRAQAHIAISVEQSQFLGNPDMQIYAN